MHVAGGVGDLARIRPMHGGFEVTIGTSNLERLDLNFTQDLPETLDCAELSPVGR
jgi:hypothetical protein